MAWQIDVTTESLFATAEPELVTLHGPVQLPVTRGQVGSYPVIWRAAPVLYGFHYRVIFLGKIVLVCDDSLSSCLPRTHATL